jgi:hypothetical protein
VVDTLRIKRRALGGAAGAPASLAVGELAFNEQDSGLYIGRSNGTIVQVNSPSGGGISDAPSDGTLYGRVSATWVQGVKLAGDTMTGTLTVAPASGGAQIVAKPLAAGQPAQFIGNIAASGQTISWFGQVAGSARWRVQLGNGAAESGSNVGSDFGISRFSDAGALIDTPLIITRSTGNWTIASQTVVQGPASGTATFALNPVSGSAVLGLGASASGQVNNLQGSIAGHARWIVQLGNGAAESGSGNTGSDFTLYRCNDAGTVLDAPISITRASGVVSFTSTVALNAPASSGTSFLLQKSASGYSNIFYGTTAGVPRWTINIGDTAPESTGNLGSNFTLSRYTDAGAGIDNPLNINRQTGLVLLNNKPAGYAMPGQLSGLTLANNAGNTSCLDVSPGGATSDDYTTPMLVPSTWTKNITAVFAIGNGVTFGGLDVGTTTGSTWYHVFLIYNPVAGIADILFSLSATAPTLPVNFTKKRRIGSILTTSGLAINPFTQLGDEFLWLGIGGGAWNEYSNAPLAGSMALTPLKYVPTGVKVVAILNCAGPVSGQTQIMSPDSSGNTFPGAWNLPPSSGGTYYVRTNTSAQFLLGANNGGTFYCNCMGWQDNRGK